MRAAVVGHLEWVDFARVENVPPAGDIVHASEWWSEPGGGGPGAAVQLLKLAGDCTFFTALGNDELGRRAHDALTKLGLRVEAVFRDEPTRRALTLVDRDGERTITVLGDRLAPRASDPLAWESLDGVDACYFTAGDAGALELARRARVLVATTRILPLLTEAGLPLDAVVGSAADPAERYEEGDLDPVPRLAVRTAGDRGGEYAAAGAGWLPFEPAPLPGPIADRYGAGDSFAGGLAYGLAVSATPGEALGWAARCGAAVVTGRGPFDGQMRLPPSARPSPGHGAGGRAATIEG